MTNPIRPLLIQEELRRGVPVQDFVDKLHLHVKRHREFPNLVLFKYDQIESPMGDELVQQCRGVILDESDNWACVTRPFDKFFNLGEGHAAPIDWGSARIQEKVDGSLMQLYAYRERWHVASSGTPDAGGQVNSTGKTFEDLFWETFDAMGMAYPLPEDTDKTFLFELTAPENRVVCAYPGGRRLTLIGARLRVYPWHEFVPSRIVGAYPQWVAVREFDAVSGPKELQATFEQMNPLSQEGYVVCDRHFRRIKVKHPGYVVAHQLRGSWSDRAALAAVRTGELPELAVHFPEMKDQLEGLRAKFETLVARLEADYLRLRDIPVQKDFALEAVKTPLRGAPLFMLRSGKTKSIRSCLATMNIDHLATAMELTAEPDPATVNPKPILEE